MWHYADILSGNVPLADIRERDLVLCAYCRSPLSTLDAGEHSERISDFESVTRRLQACPLCGWWAVSRAQLAQDGPNGELSIFRCWGALRNLDLSDVSVPTEELRSYLLAKYDDRFKIAPAKLEDIAGSVFKDFGYRVRVTSLSGDEGIDVFVFDGKNNDVVGVQVKRYRAKIEAEQIRSFAGALMLQRITKGVFITTSDYRPGALATAEKAESVNGMQISLWDAAAFYEKLKIAARPMYKSADDESAPFFELWKHQDRIPFLHETGWGFEE